MTRPVDVRGILERAGADADAPAGSQAWALAQVDAAVAELIKAAKKAEAFISIAVPTLAVDRHEAVRDILPSLRAALANIGGAK